VARPGKTGTLINKSLSRNDVLSMIRRVQPGDVV
jgi:hypothetical protein